MRQLQFFQFAVITSLLAVSAPANADPGELIDPEICTSRDRDFLKPPKPSLPAGCEAPLKGFPRRPELKYKLVAAERPIVIMRVGPDGAADTNFKVLNAYTYLTDPAHPELGSIVPPVLRIDRGDTLRIRLENELPPLPHDVPQVTNLHTHGLVVSPRGNSDNVFVLINPKGAVDPPVHPGTEPHDGAFDYAINVPRERLNMPGNNPSQSRAGLFWFHPHPHGLSQRQLAHGLSGLLAVGSVGEYADCLNSDGYPVSCDAFRRHFVMLRDFTLEKSGEDWKIVERGDAEPVFCKGVDLAGNCPPQPDLPERKWLFTANGMVKPMMRMQAGETRLVRLANVGSDITYKLEIANLDGGTAKPKVQLIAKDGIAVLGDDPLPLLLMPASRVEFMLSVPPEGGRWVIRTAGHDTGPGGDTWPPADLIEVSAPAATTVATRSLKSPRLSNVEIKEPLKKVEVQVQPLNRDLYIRSQTAPAGSSSEAAPAPAPQPSDTHAEHMAPAPARSASAVDSCLYKHLKGAQRRVITFDQMETDTAKNFMLGYAVSEPGKPPVYLVEPRTVKMDRTDVCVAAGSEETWEIINRAPEIHNFHIHQTKYMVAGVSVTSADDCKYVNLAPGAMGSDGRPTCRLTSLISDAGHDTFPIPPNGGQLTIRIAFKNYVQRGKFVFHCHLLEHEDHGMMAILELKD